MKLDTQTHNLVIDCIGFWYNDRERLNSFEIDFLSGKGPDGQYDSLIEKYEKYGEEIKLSEEQINVLRRLHDKMSGVSKR